MPHEIDFEDAAVFIGQQDHCESDDLVIESQYDFDNFHTEMPRELDFEDAAVFIGQRDHCESDDPVEELLNSTYCS